MLTLLIGNPGDMGVMICLGKRAFEYSCFVCICVNVNVNVDVYSLKSP